MPKRKEKRVPGPVPSQASRRKDSDPVSPKNRIDWKRFGVFAIVAGVGGLFIFFIASGIASETFGAPEGVEEVVVGEAAHVEGDIDYDGHPAGGEHSAVWLNCGAYSDLVPEENAVHSLEHGAVWITYPAGNEAIDVGRLNSYAGRNKVIVSPVVDQVPPVLVTAWARHMEATAADDPRISQFIVEFAGAATAPEPGGRCTGGIGEPS